MLLWPLKLALKIFGVVVLAAVVYLGITAYQVWHTSLEYRPHRANAIVVMGAAQWDGAPSPVLEARLNEADLLFHQHWAPKIVVTGGRRPGDAFTEAQASASYLEGLGVPASALLLSGGSNSYENIADCAPELRAAHIKTLDVVTDPFHEDRSMAIVSEQGFTPYPTPTQTSPIKGTKTIPYFARETVAVALGRIVGYGTLSHLSTTYG